MRTLWIILMLGLIPVQLTLAQNNSPGESPAVYAQIGADGCLLCHNNPAVNPILQTPHAREADERTPFATHGCEGCHGPSQEHVSGMGADGKRPPPNVVFGTKTSGPFPVAEASVQNTVCLGCHTSRDQQDWHGSQHQFADLACASCHTMHSAVDRVLNKATESGVCSGCHTDKRAQALRPSSHPLSEGIMSCTNCHNPHGSPAQTMLVENTVNETCYQCHTEKRGPFLWEHQPVREDCTNCHEPHGSTQTAMLRQRPPFLCNNCHSETRHPSQLRSATGLPPLGSDQYLLGRGCTNCHTQIHGSNHPAGTGLTR